MIILDAGQELMVSRSASETASLHPASTTNQLKLVVTGGGGRQNCKCIKLQRICQMLACTKARQLNKKASALKFYNHFKSKLHWKPSSKSYLFGSVHTSTLRRVAAVAQLPVSRDWQLQWSSNRIGVQWCNFIKTTLSDVVCICRSRVSVCVTLQTELHQNKSDGQTLILMVADGLCKCMKWLNAIAIPV